MADSIVWTPSWLGRYINMIKERTGGYVPIFHQYSEDNPPGLGSLHYPTLYPQVSVPIDKESADWPEVARAMIHLVDSLDGVPEIKVLGNDVDKLISRSINGELSCLSFALSQDFKYEKGDGKLIDQISEYIEADHSVRLSGEAIFKALQLLRFKLENHPLADEALRLFRDKFPNQLAKAEEVLARIKLLDLKTKEGRSIAARIIVKETGLSVSKFYAQSHKFIPGISENRDLFYYETIEGVRKHFDEKKKFPCAWMCALLPFALPVREGIYAVDGNTVLITHRSVRNERETWKYGEETSVETLMSPSGLYNISEVEILMMGEPDIESLIPPGDIMYENYKSYPEAVRVATVTINKIISSIRVRHERTDVRDLVPSDFNHMKFRQYDKNGNISKYILSLSFELIKITSGVTPTRDVVATEEILVDAISFEEDLLASAKFHLMAYNPRRAVLDLAGSFEAFVSVHIAPRLQDVATTTKTQFLRQYGDSLSPSARAEVESLEPEKHSDSERAPSVWRTIRDYQKSKLAPALDGAHLEKIRKIYSYRNDAAHGRPLPQEILDEISEGIRSLDETIDLFSG